MVLNLLLNNVFTKQFNVFCRFTLILSLLFNKQDKKKLGKPVPHTLLFGYFWHKNVYCQTILLQTNCNYSLLSIKSEFMSFIVQAVTAISILEKSYVLRLIGPILSFLKEHYSLTFHFLSMSVRWDGGEGTTSLSGTALQGSSCQSLVGVKLYHLARPCPLFRPRDCEVRGRGGLSPCHTPYGLPQTLSPL